MFAIYHIAPNFMPVGTAMWHRPNTEAVIFMGVGTPGLARG
jgi:hypothetical protein